MEKIVENVMRCICCGGTVDRFGTQESEDAYYDFVNNREKYFKNGVRLLPMPQRTGYFECSDCGAMGDLLTGIMTPMRFGK